MTEQLSPEEQQERLLEEGKAVVKQQSFLMCVSAPNLRVLVVCSTGETLPL